MNENNIPPDDRLIEYQGPHSPFQKLIDSQRQRYDLTWRQLAEKIGVSQSTLWIWLHNVNGFPHPGSLNSEHLRRLAEVLKISESEIKAALEASRPFDAFGRFIEVVESDNRQTVSKSHILNIAKSLYQILKIPQNKISNAIDASRHLFTPTEHPMPREAFNAMERFIQILENDKRHTISRNYALNIAKNLYRGSYAGPK